CRIAGRSADRVPRGSTHQAHRRLSDWRSNCRGNGTDDLSRCGDDRAAGRHGRRAPSRPVEAKAAGSGTRGPAAGPGPGPGPGSAAPAGAGPGAGRRSATGADPATDARRCPRSPRASTGRTDDTTRTDDAGSSEPRAAPSALAEPRPTVPGNARGPQQPAVGASELA